MRSLFATLSILFFVSLLCASAPSYEPNDPMAIDDGNYADSPPGGGEGHHVIDLGEQFRLNIIAYSIMAAIRVRLPLLGVFFLGGSAYSFAW